MHHTAQTAVAWFKQWYRSDTLNHFCAKRLSRYDASHRRHFFHFGLSHTHLVILFVHFNTLDLAATTDRHDLRLLLPHLF